MKLTRKFIAALVLGVIVVLGVAAAVNYQRERDLFDSHLSLDAETLGTAIGRGFTLVWERDGERAAYDFLGDINGSQASRVRTRWVWLDEPEAPRGGPHVPDVANATLAGARGGITTVRERTDKGAFAYTYVPVDVPGHRPGALEVRQPLDEEISYVSDSLRNAVIGAIALAGVCTMLALVLGVTFIGTPVKRLVDKARRVGAGDLAGPLSLRQKDELGELAREINLMCDRLATEQTARAEAMEQLRHADRLTTVGKLASGMAHELGTPLNVVAGRARLIAGGEVLGDDAKASAQIVLDQADRMTRLIRQLLDFARPRPPKKEPVDLRALAGRVASLLGPIAQKAGVSVQVSAEGADAIIEVDEGQLTQVATNLVLNAIHATPSGGRVDLVISRGDETAPADIGSRTGEFVRLEVADTGNGMDAATKARVFEPFFTTKPVGEGTGLGLSVSWGIVREHGGWISVESEPGRGSRFSVHLPAGGT
ncbi:MAG TPA: HAMP domain-containing sensor histidine kinase [Kofleriaceae bacterium]|nr:HAMP domain-containing sensor histidine kinase [Kofleriaceae bacterium]